MVGTVEALEAERIVFNPCPPHPQELCGFRGVKTVPRLYPGGSHICPLQEALNTRAKERCWQVHCRYLVNGHHPCESPFKIVSSQKGGAFVVFTFIFQIQGWPEPGRQVEGL